MIKPDYRAVLSPGIKTLKGKNAIECKFDIGTDSDKKIISVSGAAYPLSCELKDKTVNYGGRAVFTLVYQSDEGFNKIENGVEFSGKLEAEGFSAVTEPKLTLNLENVELKQDGGLTARAVASAEISAAVPNEFSVFIGGEGIESKTGEIEYNAVHSAKASVFTLEDEFEVNYPVKDILWHGEKVYVSSAQCGIGCIIIEGEIGASLCIIPLLESAEPIKEKRLIPFRLELESADALPNMASTGAAALKGASFKVFADESKNKSSVTAKFDIELTGDAVDTVKTEIVTDSYSLVNELENTFEEKSIEIYGGQYSSAEKFIGTAACEVPENSRAVCAINENFTVVSVSGDDKITADVIVSATVLFRNADGGYIAKNAEMPVSLTVAATGTIKEFKTALIDFTARIRNGGVEFDCSIKYYYKIFTSKTLKYIGACVEGEAKQKSSAAISVYIPKDGDTLWDISKELGETSEVIMLYNKDLRFPLTGEERILIYRRKQADFNL